MKKSSEKLIQQFRYIHHIQRWQNRLNVWANNIDYEVLKAQLRHLGNENLDQEVVKGVKVNHKMAIKDIQYMLEELHYIMTVEEEADECFLGENR